MRAPRGVLVWVSVALFTGCVAGLLATLGALGASLLFSVIAGIAVIGLGFQLMGGFNNLLFIFLGFHLLYGASGPVNALYGEPLSPLFSVPYETGAFLASFAYGTSALALGLFLYRVFSTSRATTSRTIAVDPALLGRVAIAFALLSSLMELSNLIRVGVTVPFEGKAIYQSAVDALTVTAPSYELSRIAIGLLGLSIAGARRARQENPMSRSPAFGKLFVLIMLPLMLLTLLLGKRGPLLDWIFIYFIASTWYESRRRISRAIAIALVIVYVTMGMMFSNRAVIAYAFLVNDFSTLADHAMKREVLVTGLNPGGNEFGAAFGNFSEYYKHDVEGPQFGRTYVEGAALVAPSFLYPGTKPQPVAYAFRDRFFPGVADEGAIASTAYSSLLEAYVNFRWAGVVLVYFVTGLVLMWLESRRRRSPSLPSALLYLSALPTAFVFHRSDFGASVISPMFFASMLIVMTMMMLYGLRGARRQAAASGRSTIVTELPEDG